VLSDIARQGGLSFIAHPHGRYRPLLSIRDHSWKDWSVGTFTGLELWSYMFDWASDFHYVRFRRHYAFPDEAISGPDPQTLALWDHLGAGRRVVAIAGVDAHARRVPLLPFVVFPYKDLFCALRTHLLTDRPVHPGAPDAPGIIFDALGKGRAFLGFDRLADTAGTRFGSEDGLLGPGDEAPFSRPVRLRAIVPREADLRLLKDGTPFQTTRGREILGSANGPGVYRAEARLDGKPWIFTNPVYLRRGA
jgi:hypothetical protein